MTPYNPGVISPEAGVALLSVIVALATLAGFGVARPRWALPTAIVLAALMTAQWIMADTGILASWDRRPPPLMLFVVVMSVLTIVTAVRVGADILASVPLWVFIGVQAFRLPLELFMHRAAVADTTRDIISGMNRHRHGASAIVVAARGDRPGARLAHQVVESPGSVPRDDRHVAIWRRRLTHSVPIRRTRG